MGDRADRGEVVDMMIGEERRTVYIEPIEVPEEVPARPDEPMVDPREPEPIPA
jgi:hypothetical protein